jgi:hypothetical protein
LALRRTPSAFDTLSRSKSLNNVSLAIHVSSLVVRNPSTQEVLIARGLTESTSGHACSKIFSITYISAMRLSKRRCKVVACLTILLECPATLLGCLVTLPECLVTLPECLVTLLGCLVTLLGCLVTLLGCLATLQECLKILSMTCLTILLTFLMIRRRNSLVSSLAVLTPSFLQAGIALRTTTSKSVRIY